MVFVSSTAISLIYSNDGTILFSLAMVSLIRRRAKYKEYLQELRDTGQTQILTTDPECHRMHTKDGFNCCYNVQAAVDAQAHLVAEYEVTGKATDQGLLHEMAEKTKNAGSKHVGGGCG